MKDNIYEASGRFADAQEEMVMIPFGAYEMAQDRFQEEKDKMRRSHRQVVTAICAVFLAFMMAVVGCVLYFISNYEISSYSQDVNTGTANFIGNNGDVINGEADNPNNSAPDAPTEGNGRQP